MLTPIAPPNHWPTRTTSSTSVTLGAGDAVVLCSNSSDGVVTTPNAASVPSMMYWVQKVGTNTALVEVKDHLGNVIVVLYVAGDSALIQSDGSNWHVIGGYLKPHGVTLYRETAQNVTANMVTKIALNGASGDAGGLADTANGHGAIKRPGEYRTTFAATWYDSFTSFVNNFQIWVYINGIRRGAATLYVPESTTRKYGQVNLLGSERYTLSAGDTVALYMSHDKSPSWDTLLGSQERPRLTIEEVR